MPFANPVSDNPLASRGDLQLAVEQLCSPLLPYYSPGGARLGLGATGAQYCAATASMEAFARVLWGLVPLVAGGGSSELLPLYLRGLRSGCDPAHPEYWKKRVEAQMFVEMAAVAYALLLAPDAFWEPLAEHERRNLELWLGQINSGWIPDSNWAFFRIMVNAALKKLRRPFDERAMDEAFATVESFYLGGGWYSDGHSEQRDYYVAFAFHFYSLVYARAMEAEDPHRSRIFKERAALFARDFIAWFSNAGAAIPFGRSQTYRFAQSCFWGALAYAGVEAYPWGVIKGIALRNLRWWLRRPIFAAGGILSIGYAYPNLVMAEGYNGPGSPYWALKSFIPLALPAEHPFWLSEELPLPKLPELSVQEEPRMAICRPRGSAEVFALSSGQSTGPWLAHAPAKYGKFAYSTSFGFSVPKGQYGLEQGAFDSSLALCERDGLYRSRASCEAHSIEGSVLYSLWRPWADVEVETWLIPLLPWQVRVHRLVSSRPLDSGEGGFAIAVEAGDTVFERGCDEPSPHACLARFPWGMSGILDLLAEREGELVWPEANTNLLHPRSAIPTLRGSHAPGESWLACAVLALPELELGQEAWARPPSLLLEEGRAVLRPADKVQAAWSSPRVVRTNDQGPRRSSR
jgi:Uncharacterized protein conserved in bacteria